MNGPCNGLSLELDVFGLMIGAYSHDHDHRVLMTHMHDAGCPIIDVGYLWYGLIPVHFLVSLVSFGNIFWIKRRGLLAWFNCDNPAPVRIMAVHRLENEVINRPLAVDAPKHGTIIVFVYLAYNILWDNDRKITEVRVCCNGQTE